MPELLEPKHTIPVYKAFMETPYYPEKDVYGHFLSKKKASDALEANLLPYLRMLELTCFVVRLEVEGNGDHITFKVSVLRYRTSLLREEMATFRIITINAII